MLVFCAVLVTLLLFIISCTAQSKWERRPAVVDKSELYCYRMGRPESDWEDEKTNEIGQFAKC